MIVVLRLVSIAFAVALSAPVALARDLSEADYLAAFHSRHPARAVLDEPVGRAVGDLRASGALSNPIAAWERESPGDEDQDTWSVIWTPPFDGRRSARKGAAQAELEAVRGERSLADAELRTVLREAFADWALSDERTAILSSHTARLRQLVARTSEQARLGQSSRLAAQRIELAVLEIEADAARADADRLGARAAAASWLGAEEDDVSPIRPPLPVESAPADATDTPAIGVRRLQLTAAEAERKSSGRFIEFPSLMLGWQTVEGAGVNASGPVFGVAWSVPLFDREQGDREASTAAVLASQARLDLETARVSATLAATMERYARLRDAALATMEAALIGDAVLEGAAARFEMGESDVTELLETVRGVLSARLAALDLYGDALAAHRAVEILIGRSWATEAE